MILLKRSCGLVLDGVTKLFIWTKWLDQVHCSDDGNKYCVRTTLYRYIQLIVIVYMASTCRPSLPSQSQQIFPYRFILSLQESRYLRIFTLLCKDQAVLWHLTPWTPSSFPLLVIPSHVISGLHYNYYYSLVLPSKQVMYSSVVSELLNHK